MMSSVYNLTRQEAASLLGISTRTLDRWIKKGKLSYEKKGNRLYLSEKEILKLKQQSNSTTYEGYISSEKNLSNNKFIYEDIKQIENILSESIEKFLKLLAEKDKIIEEKNAIIFSLQRKLGEYEIKLKNTVTLPDYTREKENLLLEKEKIEIENEYLLNKLKKEKIQKLVLFIVIITLFLLLFLLGYII